MTEIKDAPAGQPEQRGGGAPQQPPIPTPDGAAEGTRDTVSRVELERVIGERQAAKERARLAEERARKLEEDLSRLSQNQPGKDEIEEFRKWKTEAETHAREKAMKTGDVEIIERKARQPLEAQLQSVNQRLTARDEQLARLLRDQALKDAALRANAHNPDQVVALLRHRVKMTEKDGQFLPEFLDNEGQPVYDAAGRITDPNVFVQFFLAQPENANLVRSPFQAGSGAKPQGSAASNVPKPRTIDEFNALSPEQRKKASLEMTPQERKAIMGVTYQPGEGFL